MINQKIRGYAETVQRREHHWRPAVVGNSGYRIDHRVIGVVRIAILAGNRDGANLDSRIDRLHLRVVLLEALRIGVGIVRDSVSVGFP